MSSGSQSSGSAPPGPSSASTPPSEQIVRRKGSSHTGLYATIAVIVVIVVVLGGAYAAGILKFGSKSTTSCAGPTTSVAPANVATSTPAAVAPAVQPAGVTGQTISGAGSTLVNPLMLEWASKYTNNTVDYSSVGSGAGIADITEKTQDFGASDAPMTPTQQAAITPKNSVDTIPESAGAAVPIYNLPTIGVPLKFTGQILAAIYLGNITNWNNTALQLVNPGVTLPNACIIVVHRSDGSGTTFVWTSFLSKENTTWNNTIGYATSVNWPVGIGSKGNSGVTTTVKSTVDAIGYVDINYALSNAVAVGAVQNPKGNFVLANLAHIASAIDDSNLHFPAANASWYNVSMLNAPGAEDYPLATLTYVFVYQNESAAGYMSTTVAGALVDFLHWIVTVGQSYSAELYYVPLPAGVVSSDQATINSIVL